MSTKIWKELGSLELVPLTITLHAYDNKSSQYKGPYQNLPMTLAMKMITANAKVVDAQLNYNILFSHSFMYAMHFVTSYIFCFIMFLHDSKLVTIDELTYTLPSSKHSLIP